MKLCIKQNAKSVSDALILAKFTSTIATRLMFRYGWGSCMPHRFIDLAKKKKHS